MKPAAMTRRPCFSSRSTCSFVFCLSLASNGTLEPSDRAVAVRSMMAGPAEIFGSSEGGDPLALVAAYPDDVVTLVAHKPPLIPVRPDADAAERCPRRGARRVRAQRSSNTAEEIGSAC